MPTVRRAHARHGLHHRHRRGRGSPRAPWAGLSQTSESLGHRSAPTQAPLLQLTSPPGRPDASDASPNALVASGSAATAALRPRARIRPRSRPAWPFSTALPNEEARQNQDRTPPNPLPRSRTWRLLRLEAKRRAAAGTAPRARASFSKSAIRARGSSSGDAANAGPPGVAGMAADSVPGCSRRSLIVECFVAGSS